MLGRILEAIVLVLVVRAVWNVLANVFKATTGPRRATTRGEPPAVKLVRDPVCGTYVSPSSAFADGKNCFCSEECRAEFKRRAS